MHNSGQPHTQVETRMVEGAGLVSEVYFFFEMQFWMHSYAAARPVAYPSMTQTHTKSRARADTDDAQFTMPSGAHGSTAASR